MGPGLGFKQNLKCEQLLKALGCDSVTTITSLFQKPHNLSSPQATWLQSKLFRVADNNLP